jgi:hypothetical protein
VSAIVVLGALLTATGGIVAQVRPTLLLSAGERMSAAVARFHAGPAGAGNPPVNTRGS